MWALANHSPHQAERTWVRDKEAAHHWIVVVKATYDIALDGSLHLSGQPLNPLHTPVHHGPPGGSSLRYEADMVAMKPATDVYLNAQAHAPGGKPTTSVEVGLRIAQVEKKLLVHGPREWRRSTFGGSSMTASRTFTVQPIVYEAAYGGYDSASADPRAHRMDARNPVGSGFATNAALLDGKAAIQIESSERKPGEGAPAGYGALASHWMPRRAWAGTYDDAWHARRRPLLPADFDSRWFLCAPADQQIRGYMEGGEAVELTNLTPTGRLRFEIPRESLQFRTYFGSKYHDHEGRLVSVIIESEGPRLVLVWQTSLSCPEGREDELDATVIRWRAEKR